MLYGFCVVAPSRFKLCVCFVFFCLCVCPHYRCVYTTLTCSHTNVFGKLNLKSDDFSTFASFNCEVHSSQELCFVFIFI